MKNYKYQTVTLSYLVSKRSLTKKLQKSLDEMSKQGRRLVKYDFSDQLCACVVVYEKEAD